MDCPYCSFEIPAECRHGKDYQCPTCAESYRLKFRPDGSIRVELSGRAAPREREPAEPGFREWFDWLVGSQK